MTKPTVGFYDLTGCQGCQLSVLFNEDDLLDIVGAVDIKAFRFVTDNKWDGPLDIAIVEGGVVSKDDEETIKNLRERSTILVALGTCANEGCIQSMRNFRDDADLEYLMFPKMTEGQEDVGDPKPIQKVVPVDLTLPGCPPHREEVKKFFKDVLKGKIWRNYKEPVCVECRLNNNACLLDEGEICVGPLTAGGCQAICTTQGLRCYGCRGISQDAQMDAFMKLMEKKGHKKEDVIKHLETFAAFTFHKELGE